jgi:hypothetical protein
MNPLAPNPPPVAPVVGSLLEGKTLTAGEPFYTARGGVSVVVAPLPASEQAGGDRHLLTISTGFPPDPAAVSGITLWLRRPGPGGARAVRLGETDRLGSLRFSAGEPGSQYKLGVNRPAQPAGKTKEPRVLAPARFRRVEYRLAADTPGDWKPVEPAEVTLAVSPLDSGLCFSFPDAPAAVAYGSARSRDGGVLHDVFRLRVGVDGRTMEGRWHLPGDGSWEELRVEALTPAVAAALDPLARRVLASRLEDRLQDWGDERPRDDHPASYRELWQPLLAALSGHAAEGGGPTCPVCRAWADGWVAKLAGLREGLACGAPVCRAHLTGPENAALAAARDAWHRETPEVFAACEQLLADLDDEQSPVRRGFLHPYPADLRPAALHQAAGILSTVAALGRLLAQDPDRAAELGQAAADHLQSAAGLDRTSCEKFAGKLTAAAGHPLDGLWFRVASRLAGESAQGFLAFRRLGAAVTRRDSEPPPFPPLRDRPVAVRPLLYDRDRGTGVLARIEFLPVAEGCGELYVDVAPLGFRVLDPLFLRSIETAWRAVRPSVVRDNPGAAVCVRVTFGDDDSPAPALQGASAGLAVACGLLAVARGDVLDEDAAVTGELNPAGPGAEFDTSAAGWTGRVVDKLEAARTRGLARGVVGVVDEGVRYPGRLDRAARPDFEVIPARTVREAYQALRRGPFVAVRQLQDDARRRDLLRGWVEPLTAGRRAETTTEVMRHVISAYRSLRTSDGDEAAARLVREYDDLLAEHGVAVATEQHREILESLRYGLPQHPPHVPHLEISIEEILTRPGYPALLRAIRASEIDPPRAVRKFEQLARRPMFQNSAFVWYLFGQALRKEECLWEALKALERADRLIRDGLDATTDDVRLEVFRGLGAVCRKIAKKKIDHLLEGLPPDPEDATDSWQAFRARAEGYFRAGEPLIRRLPGSRLTTASDFHHSYGYFHLQFGFLEWKLGGRSDREAYAAALRRAESHFALSAKCDPDWGAPLARLQLVRHKLAQLGDPSVRPGWEEGYAPAREKTAKEAETKPEAGLTEILCGCGLLLLGRGRAGRLNPSRVLADLIDRLCRRVESKGARECHAFDLEFLRDGAGGHGLAGVMEQFRQAAKWDHLQYARFVFGRVREAFKDAPADAATRRKWTETARRLVADHLHETPGDPDAVALRDTLTNWTAANP